MHNYSNIWNKQMVRNTWVGGWWMVVGRLTNERSFESVEVFETENVSTWEELKLPTYGFMQPFELWLLCVGR